MIASLPALAGSLPNHTQAATSNRRMRVFDPRDFGAAGDGAADDTPAFRALFRSIRQAQADDDAARAHDPERAPLELIIHLSPGHYRYTWNRWTWGVKRLTVFAYGAAIQCLHIGPYAIDQAPLLSNRDHYWAWDPYGPAYGGPSTAPAEQYGFRIRTAGPGDEAIVLLSPADTGLFRPGAWVLIQSYAQQQYGYPPNLRYFERARVTRIEGALVRLDRPLLYLHRDDWPEDVTQPAAIGRARIVAIDRPDCPLALSQRFIGLTVLSNPNHAVRDPNVRNTQEVLGISGVLDAHVRDCSLIALGVSQSGNVLVEDSSFGYVEPDKLVDRLTFRNCKIGAVTECTGVNELLLQDCTIERGAQILAREIRVERCTFRGSGVGALNLEGPTPTRRMSVADCRFLGSGGPERQPVKGPVWVKAALTSPEIRLIDECTVEIAGGPVFANLVAVLEQGWPLMVQGPAGPRFCICTDISAKGNGAVFAFSASAALHRNDTFTVPRLLSLSIQGCRFLHPPGSYPDPPDLTWEDEVVGSRLLRMAIRSDAASRAVWLPGLPRRLRCLVPRAYSGPDKSCLLTWREEPHDPGRLELLINLRVPGERWVSRSDIRLLEGDSFRAGPEPAGHLPEIRYVGLASALVVPARDAVPVPANGTQAEQAEILLEVEVDNPFQWFRP
jgi:hypothetical protein